MITSFPSFYRIEDIKEDIFNTFGEKMNRLEGDWLCCREPDINKMFQVDENRTKKGLGWHKIVMISEHRSFYTEGLYRLQTLEHDELIHLPRKIKKIWRNSMEW